MSDRGSVIFCKDGEQDSVVISSYEGGDGFVNIAIDYAIELKKEVDELRKDHPNSSGPLERLEPEIIAVDFIHYLVKIGWVNLRDSSIYLYRSELDVPSAHLIYKIDLEKPKRLF